MLEQGGIFANLLFGLPIGLFFGVVIGFGWTESNWVVRILVWGSFGWLVSSLLIGLTHQPSDNPRFLSWQQVRQNIIGSEVLRNMLGLGVLAGLLGTQLWFWSARSWHLSLRTGLTTGTIGALSFGLLGILMSGLVRTQLDKRNLITPNQGIRNSAYNCLRVGLLFGLIIGLFSAFLGIIAFLRGLSTVGVLDALIPMVFYLGMIGILGGFLAGLTHGGMACIPALGSALLPLATRIYSSAIYSFSRLCLRTHFGP